ncbi:MAG: DoxX family protein [Rhodobacteraceae bacterium]|nr:DoxX family protein [Paracoccaceae bacterium]
MIGISLQQRRINAIAHAIARVLIASYFMSRAAGLIIDPASMNQFLAVSDVPDYLRWPNAGFEFLAAFAIMIGFQTRTAAALLALYVFWSSFILNYAPGDAYAIGAFWRDLAMIGGLLLLFSHGRGCLAVDNLFLGDEAEADTTPPDAAPAKA